MKAVILDMYGVILKDTGAGFYTYVNKFFADLTPAEIYAVRKKADIGEISYLDVFRLLGFKEDLAMIEKEYLDTVEIDETFYEFAEKIKKQYKLALLSNDSSDWSRYFQEKFCIAQYFDVITVSGDVKMLKPDERIFQMTAEKLGVTPEECAYVDDRRRNVCAALSVGMEGILFNRKQVEFVGKTVNSFRKLQDLLLLEL